MRCASMRPIVVGMLLLGLFEAAYLGRRFSPARWRASVAAPARGGAGGGLQYGADLPPRFDSQAVRRVALPGTTGELVSLIKNSSLLSVLGIEEVTQITPP